MDSGLSHSAVAIRDGGNGNGSSRSDLTLPCSSSLSHSNEQGRRAGRFQTVSIPDICVEEVVEGDNNNRTNLERV